MHLRSLHISSPACGRGAREASGGRDIQFNPHAYALDGQFSTVIDDEGADQVEGSGRAEEHQGQDVTSRQLDDHANDDRHENAADISSEVHDAAENADTASVGQYGRNAPIQSPPTQKEQ